MFCHHSSQSLQTEIMHWTNQTWKQKHATGAKHWKKYNWRQAREKIQPVPITGKNTTGTKHGKKYNRRQAREKIQPAPSAGKIQPVPSAGINTTGAKRCEKYNQCQARENVQPVLSAGKHVSQAWWDDNCKVITADWYQARENVSKSSHWPIRARSDCKTKARSFESLLMRCCLQTYLFSFYDCFVFRIDANVETTELNVEAAHGELLKYFQSVTSNRWLIIKIFCVLIIFFVVFVVFMAWNSSTVLRVIYYNLSHSGSFLYEVLDLFIFLDIFSMGSVCMNQSKSNLTRPRSPAGNLTVAMTVLRFWLVESYGTHQKVVEMSKINQKLRRVTTAHVTVARSWGVTLCRRAFTAGLQLRWKKWLITVIKVV